jgi:MFS family permease
MAGTAFSFPDFRRLVTARLLFTIGTQMQAVVTGWLIYELYRDPLYLGLIGAVEALPALGLALVAGYLVDRSNPVHVYRGVLVVSLASALMLFASTLLGGEVSVSDRAALIYASAFLTGLARGFTSPAVYSMMPQMVPREALAASSAWLTSAFQVAAVGGPALGGLIFGFGGARLATLIQVVLLVLGFFVFLGIRLQPKVVKRVKGEPILENLLVGVRYVFKNQYLLSALSLDMFAVLFGGVTALLPLFASDILNVGPEGLGLLRAAPAVGALLVSVFLIRRPIRKNAGRILLASVAAFGLCILGFGVSESFWISALILALSGAVDAISMVVRGTVVALHSPEHMRGRIAAVNSMFIGSSNELGALESGVAAKLLGTVPSVLFGGTMTLIVVAVTAWRAPKLRELELK